MTMNDDNLIEEVLSQGGAHIEVVVRIGRSEGHDGITWVSHKLVDGHLLDKAIAGLDFVIKSEIHDCAERFVHNGDPKNDPK
jgi:hypothetical protein